MPFSLFNIFWLVAYPTHQVVQSMGSTSYVSSCDTASWDN